MDILEKIEKTEMIGREFLVWLWYRSETYGGLLETGDALRAVILIDGKMTLETEEKHELVTCSGDNPLMKEARLALLENKKITKSAIKIIVNDEDEYTFMLDSTWMNFRALKTPRVIQDFKDDPDGLFYEKIGLIEKAVQIMDDVFIHFIKLRISPQWESEELPALINWIKGVNTN
jgi:hypothetical protein